MKNVVSKRRMFREDGGEWCECTIELRENDKGELCLSITGAEGYVLTEEQAEAQAQEYLTSYFEEDPAALVSAGTVDPEEAARNVLSIDGLDAGGLDLSYPREGDPDLYYATTGCGCMHDEISKWFPEVAPYVRYHLNDMKAGCEHQRALGWGRGKTIAITKDTATPVQLAVFAELAEARAERHRKDYIRVRLDYLREHRSAVAQMLVDATGRERVSVDEVDAISLIMDRERYGKTSQVQGVRSDDRANYARIREHLEKLAAANFPVQEFDAELFKDSMSAPCPECGYRYGTAWLTEPLPAEVVAWAKGETDETD